MVGCGCVCRVLLWSRVVVTGIMVVCVLLVMCGCRLGVRLSVARRWMRRSARFLGGLLGVVGILLLWGLMRRLAGRCVGVLGWRGCSSGWMLASWMRLWWRSWTGCRGRRLILLG